MNFQKVFLNFVLLSLLVVSSCKKDEPEQIVDNSAKIPTVTTSSISEIMQTTAVCGGEIINDGGYTVTARGVCWSTNQNPTISDNKTSDGSGAGIFTSSMTGLRANTTYYIRAYATNSYGTGYGSSFVFTTLDILVDVDGNEYAIVKIGDQIWMAENLKTTRYNNGTSIPLVTDASSWGNLSTAAYCWYDNNEVYYGDTYGALYNFYTVAESNLCPMGWHVATKTEWEEFITYVGGASVAGGVLKETGYSHWNMPNTGATDEYGFSVLPGGYRHYTGSFAGIGTTASFWTSDPASSDRAYEIGFANDNASVSGDANGEFMKHGYSVRCIKN